MAYCFKDKSCTNCLTKECVDTFDFLKTIKFEEVIGSGHQGIVVNAIHENKEIAIKFEILNSYPVTMTNRDKINCNSLWFQIPGMAKLVRSYKEFSTRNLTMYKKTSTQDFEKECEFAQNISNLKAGPNVLFNSVCIKGLETKVGLVDVGILAMEKYDFSLSDYIKALLQFPPLEFEKSLHTISQICKSLRKIGKRLPNFSHGDLHDENVLLLNIVKPKRRWRTVKVGLIDFGFTQKMEGLPLYLEIENLILYIKSKLFSVRFLVPISTKHYLKLFQFIQKM